MIAERERDGDAAVDTAPLPDIQPESGAPELPSIVPPPAIYTCDPSTLERNLEASELAEIIARVIGGWSVSVPADEWSAMRPDVRRHFRRTV